ncbi:MAG: glutamate synthase-related protein [Candidatus Melainabacteria bacterium]|nr:glutamate synthase-related protein [Candidatus Melainabacteria bacterium]
MSDLKNKAFEAEHDACGVGFIYRPERTRSTIDDALTALAQMEHRGATGWDGITGDGAGILAAIPKEIFRKEGISIDSRDAVAVLFVPDQLARKRSTQLIALHRDLIERFVKSQGFTARIWRIVPVARNTLGPVALQACPVIEHLVVSHDGNLPEKELDIAYANLRIAISQFMRFQIGEPDFYIASLCRKTIVYKAMTTSEGLTRFYADLQDANFKSNWAVFHRRFSTNTVSRWPLAQPFRLLAHNGEINTLKGNLNWLHARLSQSALEVKATWDDTTNELCPGSQVDYAGSDSSVLDFCVETLLKDGDSIESAFMKLVPEAHEHHSHLTEDPEIEHFYEFYAPHQEPWDGPAMVAFCDATTLGAILDRNGLRPARYTIYKDGSVILASEAGIAISTDAAVAKKGRLGPGQMIAVDLASGSIRHDIELKKSVAQKHPYGQWLLKERRVLKDCGFSKEWTYNEEEMVARQVAAGYTLEDVDAVVTFMAINDSEPVFSMGDDTPLAVLSERPKKLSDYFRQRFAQVTNPPIDPIRERLVMSLTSYLGKRSLSLNPDPILAQTILLPSPILNDDELHFLESLSHEYKWARVATLFNDDETLENAIARVCDEVAEHVRNGSLIIFLSDRDTNAGRTAIPMLAAVGAVHHHLIKAGLRLKSSLVVETSQCWTSHHLAALIAYGAQSVVPYLAFEVIRHWYWGDKVQKLVHGHGNSSSDTKSDSGASAIANEKFRGLTVYQCQTNYKAVLESGLLKIISKMGVSKLTSYVGAQIFECLGLGDDIVERCFAGTNSPIGGLTFADLEREVRAFHNKAYSTEPRLIDEGILKHKRTGEYHRNNNELVKALHNAVALKESDADDKTRAEQYKSYSSLVAKQPPSSLRELFEIKSDRRSIDVSEVESVEEIVTKFCSGGMSLGALSKESHEALAIAMNRLGARSNSGEGGEDPKRYHPINVDGDGTSSDFPGLTGLRKGDSAASKIRQVASARFGVTPEYLATAEQLEIKVAQGAKPGEGGQLPSHKVSDYIARLRRTERGITLISPPPHHDIYSIEDLAQLIFDLRQINQTAKISVKLVSEQGIGPIALGCAKAGADIVHVAGHDGGTGAAPVGSIKHAGLPWELGLAETNRFLTEHRLRDLITVRVDGGLRSGTDVVKAAIIGGDEFAFGTIALIAQGCIMARVCHTNNCPTGVASQKESLRERFPGNPGTVVEFFKFIAEEVRYLLASLGYKSLAEIRGRTELLSRREDVKLSKCASLDLSEIVAKPALLSLGIDTSVIHGGIVRSTKYGGLINSTVYERLSGNIAGATSCGINELIINDPSIRNAVENQSSVIKSYHLRNMDRTVGASLSGLIATKHGDSGFTGQIVLNFEGTAGQSFAAFNAKNVLMYLKGEANDYVAKSMFGGEVVVRPDNNLIDINAAEPPVLVGNTCLYGAVGGKLLVAGSAGERFAVRNSGAQAVVEGVGDHGCEYMTGGTVVVLGTTGRNFGAGMSGGIAYILDEDNTFVERVNRDCDKELYRLSQQNECKLMALIEDHFRLTSSPKARRILDHWDQYRDKFIQVVPPAERERACGGSKDAYRDLLIQVEDNNWVRDSASA